MLTKECLSRALRTPTLTLAYIERHGVEWPRRKLRELRNERDFLRDQLGRFDQGRRKVSQEAREREELLARRHAVSKPIQVKSSVYMNADSVSPSVPRLSLARSLVARVKHEAIESD